MIKGVYSIFDEKAATFGMPMCFIRDEEAVRSFDVIANEKNSMLCMYPGDYKLYKLGTIDDVAGKIVCEEIPVFMNNASEFVKPAEITD